MRESMIADSVAFLVNAPGQAVVFLRLHSDQEEGGLGVLPFKDIENRRSVSGVRAVIKGERNFPGLGAGLNNLVGFRKIGHLFGGNQAGNGVDSQITRACAGTMGDIENLSITFAVYILAGRDVLQLFLRAVFHG